MKPNNKEEMKGCRFKRHTNNTFRRSHLKPGFSFFSVSHISDVLEKQTGPQTQTHAEGFFLSNFFFFFLTILWKSKEKKKKWWFSMEVKLWWLNVLLFHYGPLFGQKKRSNVFWNRLHDLRNFSEVPKVCVELSVCQLLLISQLHVCVRQCKRSTDYVAPNVTLISWSCQ